MGLQISNTFQQEVYLKEKAIFATFAAPLLTTQRQGESMITGAGEALEKVFQKLLHN